MADETPPPAADQDGDQDGDDAFDAERAKAKISKANSEAAGLRKRLKELEPLARKAQEQDDARKTAEERTAEKLNAAERRAADAEAATLRVTVAYEKGLTPSQAKRLVGSTREELEADADDLLTSFPAAPAVPAQVAPPGRPKERMRPGAVPAANPAGPNMNDLIRAAAGHR